MHPTKIGLVVFLFTINFSKLITNYELGIFIQNACFYHLRMDFASFIGKSELLQYISRRDVSFCIVFEPDWELGAIEKRGGVKAGKEFLPRQFLINGRTKTL